MAQVDDIRQYMPPRDLLKDKVILITGPGGGIGKAVALAAARLGARLILLGRTVSHLESLYDEIMAENCPEPAICPMNLSSATLDDFAQVADTIMEKYGHLDGLLHNASILGERVPMQTCDPMTFMQVMQVNFNAPVFLTQALMPALMAAESASVVFTTSGVGLKPRAYWGAYALSKYATEGLGYLLADELENTSHIRVNLINPGATRTGMRAAAYPGEDPMTLKTPAEIANAYLYLLGPESSGVNGERFNAQ